jgi:hypothetical protein
MQLISYRANRYKFRMIYTVNSIYYCMENLLRRIIRHVIVLAKTFQSLTIIVLKLV